MGATNAKICTDKFPNPETYEDVRDAYEHLKAKGVKFSPSEDAKSVNMEMPEGWSFLRLNGENYLILNDLKCPEILYHVNISEIVSEIETKMAWTTEVQELKADVDKDIQENNTTDNLALVQNNVETVKDLLTIDRVAKLTNAKTVAADIVNKITVKCFVLTGWKDPQIPAYLLERYTIPLPEFYQVRDRMLELSPDEKWSHLALLAKEIEQLKDTVRMCFAYRLSRCDIDSWNCSYEAKYQELKRYVNTCTNMTDYAEYRKYFNFLNNPILKTHVEICEHLNKRYRKYCHMTPEDRQFFNVNTKMSMITIVYRDIIRLNDGLDRNKLDYNPETTAFVLIKQDSTSKEC